MKSIMKTTMQEIKMMVVGLLVLSGTMQAAAVDYKNTYKSPMVSYQSATVGIQTTTATAPSASFQSTSAMPYARGAESTLNADGTVNEEAYGVGRRNAGPRKINNPGETDQNENGEPLGDAVLPLLLLACAYMCLRPFLKRKRATES